MAAEYCEELLPTLLHSQKMANRGAKQMQIRIDLKL